MGPRFIICIAMIGFLHSQACAVTMAFDEVPSGTVLYNSSYAYDNRVVFSDDFRATDHTGSDWGPPYSPSNVLTSVGRSYGESGLFFGRVKLDGPYPDPVGSVSAYFSTQPGAMVRISAYRYNPNNPMFSLVMGNSGESWDNRYVEITSSQLPFYGLKFEGVNSPNDLLGFAADDMTITLVPEPSSLLALAGGLAALGLLRRRVISKQ